MTETAAPPTVHHAFEPLLKKQQMQHMEAEHGVKMHPKILKDHLIEEHTTAHRVIDFAATTPSDEQIMAFIGQHGITEYMYRMYSNRERYTPHTHEVAAPVIEATDAEVIAAHEAISKGEKPIAKLSAAERKALTALVDNDFAALTAEMKAFATDVKRSRKQAAIEEFEVKKTEAEKYRKRLVAASEKFAKAVDKIKADAEADGFRVNNMPYRHNVHGNTTFEVAALNDALNSIDSEVNADLERALSEVRTAHLAAQRTILLTGVPEGVAMQVLNSIPSAKDMMVQAAQAAEQPSIEAGPWSWSALSRDEKVTHLVRVHQYSTSDFDKETDEGELDTMHFEDAEACTRR